MPSRHSVKNRLLSRSLSEAKSSLNAGRNGLKKAKLSGTIDTTLSAPSAIV